MSRERGSCRWLSETDVEKLIDAAKFSNNGRRNSAALLLAYRHGLRASELVSLKWSDFDLDIGIVNIQRSRRGITNVHPLSTRELLALRQHKATAGNGPHWVISSSRGGPISVAAFQGLVARIGRTAGIQFTNHSSLFTLSCRNKLTGDGYDDAAIAFYLGVRSAASQQPHAAEVFRLFWPD